MKIKRRKEEKVKEVEIEKVDTGDTRNQGPILDLVLIPIPDALAQDQGQDQDHIIEMVANPRIIEEKRRKLFV